MIATQPRPVTHTTASPPQPVPPANGRDARGRFVPGNAGGPGNPFYRRQAEFRRAMLALFTPEDVASLLRVMLALGRNGDVAAARVFLEYVVGKPHKAPDPDREEHHEWQLFAEAPRLADVSELLENGVPADLATDATRDAVPHLAANRLEGVFDQLDAAAMSATGPAEPAVVTPAEGPRNHVALQLLTAALRAAVANGVNGAAPPTPPPGCHRPTAENGEDRTVATADNGQGHPVATVDNGPGRERPAQPGEVATPGSILGVRLE
jgi:hypothetical protein